MDFMGRKKLAEARRELESQKQVHAEKVKRLRDDLSFMVKNATDEQLVHWARQSATEVAKLEGTDPDWERIHAENLTNLAGRLLIQDQMLKGMLDGQEWEMKIYRADRENADVRVIGDIEREQVPALLYRLAARYAEEELGSTVEVSLRFEVEKYLQERNEARDELARQGEAPAD